MQSGAGPHRLALYFFPYCLCRKNITFYVNINYVKRSVKKNDIKATCSHCRFGLPWSLLKRALPVLVHHKYKMSREPAAKLGW